MCMAAIAILTVLQAPCQATPGSSSMQSLQLTCEVGCMSCMVQLHACYCANMHHSHAGFTLVTWCGRLAGWQVAIAPLTGAGSMYAQLTLCKHSCIPTSFQFCPRLIKPCAEMKSVHCNVGQLSYHEVCTSIRMSIWQCVSLLIAMVMA